MQYNLRHKALVKLAFFGPSIVPGTPVYLTQPPTVGQMMYNAGSNLSMPGSQRRTLMDQIVGTGVNVNSPAKNLLKAGIGALAGNFVANALHTGPFVRGMLTATGANYGYNY